MGTYDSGMPQCPSCAAPVTGASRRCTACGHVAGAVETAVHVTEPAARATFQRDALQPAVPPPGRPPSRIPTVLLGGVALMIAGAAVALGFRPGGGEPNAEPSPSASASPTPAGYAGAPTGTVLLARTPQGARAIDVDAGRSHPVSLVLGRLGDEARPEIALATGEIVYLVDGRRAVVAPAERLATGRDVGPGEIVMAAPRGDAFWAFRHDGGKLRAAEYDHTGRPLRSGTMPGRLRPMAVVDSGFVVATRPDEQPASPAEGEIAFPAEEEVAFSVVDLAGREVRKFSGGFFVAAKGDRIAWIAGCFAFPVASPSQCGLRVTDLPDGTDVPLPLGYEDSTLGAGDARFSPDGRLLALFEHRRSGAEPVVIDVEERTAAVVPDLELNGELAATLTWSPDGRWLFVSAPRSRRAGSPWAFDTRTSTLVQFPRLPFSTMAFLR